MKIDRRLEKNFSTHFALKTPFEYEPAINTTEIERSKKKQRKKSPKKEPIMILQKKTEHRKKLSLCLAF